MIIEIPQLFIINLFIFGTSGISYLISIIHFIKYRYFEMVGLFGLLGTVFLIWGLSINRILEFRMIN